MQRCIKSCVPRFDGVGDVRIAWVKDNVGKLERTRDNGRFGVKTAFVKSE